MDLDPSSGPEAKAPWTVLSPLEDRSDWCDQARLAGRETLSYRGTGSSNNSSPGGAFLPVMKLIKLVKLLCWACFSH